PPVSRIVANSTPAGHHGEVILMHDAGGDRSRTVAGLERLIPRLRAQGYRFATTAQVIGESRTNPPAARDQRYRGALMVGLVGVAGAIVSVLALLLLTIGRRLAVRRRPRWVLPAGPRPPRPRPPGPWGRPAPRPVPGAVPASTDQNSTPA